MIRLIKGKYSISDLIEISDSLLLKEKEERKALYSSSEFTKNSIRQKYFKEVKEHLELVKKQIEKKEEKIRNSQSGLFN